jgi:hypothetical protein
MTRCPVCREEFRPDNPASLTVMLADVEGEAVWLPVCRACAVELEVTELAAEHQ